MADRSEYHTTACQRLLLLSFPLFTTHLPVLYDQCRLFIWPSDRYAGRGIKTKDSADLRAMYSWAGPHLY